MEKNANKGHPTVINREGIKKEMQGYRVSKSFLDNFEKEIKEMLNKAKKRAVLNGRRTLLARDI